MLAAIVVVVVLAIVLPGRTFVAESGDINFEMNSSGIIIRSEKLYKSENYGKTEFIAKEGEAVTKGTPIAEVYSWDYNDQDYKDLKELQETIMDYQQQNILKNVRDKDIESLNSLIEEKTDEIRMVVKGEKDGDLLALDRELDALMKERSEFLRDAAAEDGQLKNFYEKEQALISRIENWKQTILAEDEGVVSFYFDGTETILTPANMKKLTVKNINDVMQGKTYYTADMSAATRPLYRLVNQNEWYVVMIADKLIPEFENNTSFKVQFTGSETAYYGKVSGHTEDSGKIIYYFAFEQPIDKLLLARQVEMKISASYVGVKVPVSAVKKQDDVVGVYYRKGEEKVFEPVEVLIENEGYAIVQPVDLKSALGEGSQIYS